MSDVSGAGCQQDEKFCRELKFHSERWLKIDSLQGILDAQLMNSETKVLQGDNFHASIKTISHQTSFASAQAFLDLASQYEIVGRKIEEVDGKFELNGHKVSISLSETENVLCVAHLPKTFNDTEFESLLSMQGDICWSFMMHNKYTKQSCRYGFVKYRNITIANRAQRYFHNRRIKSSHLYCDWLNRKMRTYEDLHSLCLFIENLPLNYCDYEDLRRIFSIVVKPIYCQIIMNRTQTTGYGIVEFPSVAEACKTHEALQNTVIDGQIIELSFCMPGVKAADVVNKLDFRTGLLHDPPANIAALKDIQLLCYKNPQEMDRNTCYAIRPNRRVMWGNDQYSVATPSAALPSSSAIGLCEPVVSSVKPASGPVHTNKECDSSGEEGTRVSNRVPGFESLKRANSVSSTPSPASMSSGPFDKTSPTDSATPSSLSSSWKSMFGMSIVDDNLVNYDGKFVPLHLVEFQDPLNDFSTTKWRLKHSPRDTSHLTPTMTERVIMSRANAASALMDVIGPTNSSVSTLKVWNESVHVSQTPVSSSFVFKALCKAKWEMKQFVLGGKRVTVEDIHPILYTIPFKDENSKYCPDLLPLFKCGKLRATIACDQLGRAFPILSDGLLIQEFDKRKMLLTAVSSVSLLENISTEEASSDFSSELAQQFTALAKLQFPILLDAIYSFVDARLTLRRQVFQGLSQNADIRELLCSDFFCDTLFPQELVQRLAREASRKKCSIMEVLRTKGHN